MKQLLSISGYLAIKEIWRNRGRFLLVSLVIALITLLVLFVAALGEGLGNGNREYLSKLDAQLIAYQAKSDFLISASRLDQQRLAAVRRQKGVADAGMLGTAAATIILPEGMGTIKVSLIGVEPGHPGEPKVQQGQQLRSSLSKKVILDRNTALRGKLSVGDTLYLRVTQGTDDKFYDLRVVGISDGQQYSLQPSIFVPFDTWDRIRPKSEAEVDNSNLVGNVILIKLDDPAQIAPLANQLRNQVNNIDIATLREAIQAVPGYTAQQSTLNTQGGFTLFIGIMVIGGFFQIQVLQKVAQIGVLKAIGTSNASVAAISILQIGLITLLGVFIGGILAYLLSLSFPPTVPIIFNGSTSALAIIALLLIGPLGGLVSIRYAVRIEPLKALGLNS